MAARPTGDGGTKLECAVRSSAQALMIDFLEGPTVRPVASTGTPPVSPYFDQFAWAAQAWRAGSYAFQSVV